LFVILASFGFIVHLLAQNQQLTLAQRFTGTWKRDDGDETVTLSVNHDAVDGDAVVITNSDGAIGSGILKGDKILYTGALEAEGGGRAKVAGAYMVSPDGTSLIKLRKIILVDGTKEDTATYSRVTPPVAMSTPVPTPPPLLAAREDETSPAKPAAPATPTTPFVGTWRAADGSAKVTISLNGKSATIKYPSGPRETGTMRGNKIECEPTTTDGMKTTDIFEMSSNGRTLIRRRILQSAKGETGTETLTYNRGD
jgi:uncharacterized protein (DUF2147 family)